jgi:hypothetical protein
MAHYLITLVIETEEGQGSPAQWDWPQLIDSPHGVAVIACTGIGDEPSVEESDDLHDRVGQVHRDLAGHLG